MRKIKTKCGYTAYITSKSEVQLLGGFGLCDHCNTLQRTGYLVPVLNHFLCERCYNDFDERAIYYRQDIAVETRNADYYESVIPLEEGDEKDGSLHDLPELRSKS